MGFVDGDAGELALGVDCFDVTTEGLGETELWGHVEETSKRMTAAEVIEDCVSIFRWCIAVDGGNGYICCVKSGDLVVLVDCKSASTCCDWRGVI